MIKKETWMYCQVLEVFGIGRYLSLKETVAIIQKPNTDAVSVSTTSSVKNDDHYAGKKTVPSIDIFLGLDEN